MARVLDINHAFPHPLTVGMLIRTFLQHQVGGAKRRFPNNGIVD
jgi:hypothetical protein